jgi:hypothetical protein
MRLRCGVLRARSQACELQPGALSRSDSLAHSPWERRPAVAQEPLARFIRQIGRRREMPLHELQPRGQCAVVRHVYRTPEELGPPSRQPRNPWFRGRSSRNAGARPWERVLVHGRRRLGPKRGASGHASHSARAAILPLPSGSTFTRAQFTLTLTLSLSLSWSLTALTATAT